VGRSGFLFALVVAVAAACSSFEEGKDDTTPPASLPDGGGGTDGTRPTSDGGTPEPATPERVTAVDGSFSVMCASSRGVAWTQPNLVGAVIDGNRRTDTATSNTQGGCVLTQATLVFTTFGAIDAIDFGDPAPDATPSVGTVVFSLAQPIPLATDGLVYFTAEKNGAKRIVESAGGGASIPIGNVGETGGDAKSIVANTTHVVLGTTGGELQYVSRGGDAATVIGAVGSVTGLALVAERLYVSTPTAIKTCAPPMCSTLDDVATNLAGAAELAVAGDVLYWVERDGDRVMSCKRQSCGSPTTLAKLTKPIHLALGDRVYVSDVENVIWSIPK
jgi:hypothetical protein